MNSNPVRILLVDDHQLMLKGLQLQLEQVNGLEIVGAAATGKQAVEFSRHRPANLAVVDLHLPDMSGLDLARSLRAEHPGMRIIILSCDASFASVKMALQAGVAGYVLKENSDRELLMAIHQAMAGKPYLCPEVSAAVLEDYKRTLDQKVERLKPELSEREREVLQLVAKGLRNKEIAAQLNISVKSVETYRRRVMEKLHVNGTAELTRYAIREGIVSL